MALGFFSGVTLNLIMSLQRSSTAVCTPPAATNTTPSVVILALPICPFREAVKLHSSVPFMPRSNERRV